MQKIASRRIVNSMTALLLMNGGGGNDQPVILPLVIAQFDKVPWICLA